MLGICQYLVKLHIKVLWCGHEFEQIGIDLDFELKPGLMVRVMKYGVDKDFLSTENCVAISRYLDLYPLETVIPSIYMDSRI